MVVNITKDPIKIIFFALGTLVGSYLGSIIEEKLSLGDNLIISIVNNKVSNLIIDELKFKNYEITCMNGNNNKKIIFVVIPRKQKLNIINIIKKYDKKSKIILENTNEVKEKS